MVDKFPLVSVIIPTYKRPKYLEEAILSVKAQSYPNIEIIVVDDNSWEETSIVAEKFADVTFFTNEKNFKKSIDKLKIKSIMVNSL